MQNDGQTLFTYDRASDGSLARTGCHRNTAASGCTVVPLLSNANTVEVSPLTAGTCT